MTAVLQISPTIHLKPSYLLCRKMTDEAHTTHKMCKSIFSWQKQLMIRPKKRRKKKNSKRSRDVVFSSSHTLSSGLGWACLPLCRCKIQEAATVLFKILGKFFFFFPSVCVCVEDFTLYVFFMGICMLKELLQEYLKRQNHFHGRVVSHDNIRAAEIFQIPSRDIKRTSVLLK